MQIGQLPDQNRGAGDRHLENQSLQGQSLADQFGSSAATRSGTVEQPSAGLTRVCCSLPVGSILTLRMGQSLSMPRGSR